MKKLIIFIIFLISVNFVYCQRTIDTNRILVRDSLKLNTDWFSLSNPQNGQILQRITGRWENVDLGEIGALYYINYQNTFSEVFFGDTVATINFKTTDFDGTGIGTDSLEISDMLKNSYLKLDQTTPQTVSNGAPKFAAIDMDTTTALDLGGFARVSWSDSEETLQWGVEGGTIDGNKEVFDIYVDNTGGLLNEGNVVSVVAISGNRQAVGLTDNTDKALSTACIGMVTYVKADGHVRVTKKGRVRGLNTDGLTEGLPVYANSTGGYTQTVPAAGTYFIHVGIVEVAHQQNGIIDVDIQVVLNLEDASNVNGIVTEILPTDSILVKRDSIWHRVTWENSQPCNQTVQTLNSTADTLTVSNGVNGYLDITANTTIRIEPTAKCNTGNITVMCDASGYTLTFASDYVMLVSPFLDATAKVITTTATSGAVDVYSWWFDGTRIMINGTKNYE